MYFNTYNSEEVRDMFGLIMNSMVRLMADLLTTSILS